MATLYWKDVNGRNWPVCSCLKAWLTAYQNELLRRGIIKHGLDLYQTIGGSPKSGGTHVSGQCVDTAQTSAEAIKVARQMGADAGWHRPYNWDNAGGGAHAHLNLRGCPHGSAAADRQYSSTFQGVDHGKNGLANGGKDTGPRPLSGRTWKEGIAWAKAQAAADVPKTTLRVMTWNVPAGDKLPDTAGRIAQAAKVVAKLRPDVIGWNELEPVRDGDISAFARVLDKAIGAKWLLVRPTLAWNENYISFDRERLKLVKQYADQILPGKTGGRHITRAVFQTRDTGFTFAVGQTHLVNGATAQGEVDRQQQAALARHYMLNVTAHHDDCPFIIQGDVNTAKDLVALSKAGMKRTRKYADESANRDATTYTNKSKLVPSTNSADWVIDHQYVSPAFNVLGYTVEQWVDSAGRFIEPRPSDHSAVISSIRTK